jgi:hypothetical protein
MRRLSRSILVLSVVVCLATPAAHARIINDDGDPRTRPITPRIVRVIKKVIRFFVWAPSDDGNLLAPPKP